MVIRIFSQCGFSKFVFILPIPNKKGATIAKTLFVKVFSVLGMPARLHSDRGKEFTNMLNLLGIAQSTTTAYHPQGNAYAERIHKFFRSAIAL